MSGDRLFMSRKLSAACIHPILRNNNDDEYL